MRIECPKCNAAFIVADENVGRQGRCKRCNATFIIDPPSTRVELEPGPAGRLPATARQRDFARELGIPIDGPIDRRSLSKLISVAVDRRDKEELKRLASISSCEGEAYEQVRKQILEDLDPTDIRLSLASPEQMMQSLSGRGLGAILLHWTPDEEAESATAFKRLEIAWTDDLFDEVQMRAVLQMIGLKVGGLSVERLAAISDTVDEASGLIDELRSKKTRRKSQ